MLTGISHITFAVTDLCRSIEFYCDILGFKNVHQWQRGVYLEAGDLWLCLSLAETVAPREDYSHVAFRIDADGYAMVAQKVSAAKIALWQENKSEGLSLYLLDPDGHKLEVHVGDLASRLDYYAKSSD